MQPFSNSELLIITLFHAYFMMISQTVRALSCWQTYAPRHPQKDTTENKGIALIGRHEKPTPLSLEHRARLKVA